MKNCESQLICKRELDLLLVLSLGGLIDISGTTLGPGNCTNRHRMEKFGLLSAHKDRSIFDSGRKRNEAATFFLLFGFRKKTFFAEKKFFLVVPAESEMSKQLFFFFFLFSFFLFFLFFMTKEQLHEKSQVGYSDPFIVPTFFSPDRLCSIRFDPLR